MYAAGEGHTEIVKALLAKGANPNAKDMDGGTALMRATKRGHTKVANLLKKHGATE
jgi:ankyrin repeat protein